MANFNNLINQKRKALKNAIKNVLKNVKLIFVKNMKNQKTNLQIINYLNNILKKNFLINLKKPILISVSGGQDSICLLLLFLHLKKSVEIFYWFNFL